MVSLWPWKGDETSTATFEKTLQVLTNKISKANAQNALLRNRSRRFKALWTLYTSIVYILYSLISILVTGRNQWSPVEYTALAAGPVMIYAVRAALSTYYDYRLSSSQSYLEDLHKQRSVAIERFKNATKYNSTQQLLEKYGAEGSATKKATPKATPDNKPKNKDRRTSAPRTSTGRTNMTPPSTANIPRPVQVSAGAPSHQSGPSKSTDVSASSLSAVPGVDNVNISAEFAPNAESGSAQYVSNTVPNHWYDRFMDLLLGEDETKPSNRLVLICVHCRLVNGQAPPGMKGLEELGRWRCSSCHGWNGEESEIKKILGHSPTSKETDSTPQSPTTGPTAETNADSSLKDEAPHSSEYQQRPEGPTPGKQGQKTVSEVSES